MAHFRQSLPMPHSLFLLLLLALWPHPLEALSGCNEFCSSHRPTDKPSSEPFQIDCSSTAFETWVDQSLCKDQCAACQSICSEGVFQCPGEEKIKSSDEDEQMPRLFQVPEEVLKPRPPPPPPADDLNEFKLKTTTEDNEDESALSTANLSWIFLAVGLTVGSCLIVAVICACSKKPRQRQNQLDDQFQSQDQEQGPLSSEGYPMKPGFDSSTSTEPADKAMATKGVQIQQQPNANNNPNPNVNNNRRVFQV